MELTRDWLKAEHERTLAAMLDTETTIYMQLNIAFYNLGLALGEYQGRLKALDELLEIVEKTDEPELSHTDPVPFSNGCGDPEQPTG
jgi:hypothetical protein